MNLHITMHPAAIAPQLKNGMTEIRPRLKIPDTRINYPELSAAHSAQLRRAKR
jgi:hypothetical protein